MITSCEKKNSNISASSSLFTRKNTSITLQNRKLTKKLVMRLYGNLRNNLKFLDNRISSPKARENRTPNGSCQKISRNMLQNLVFDSNYHQLNHHLTKFDHITIYVTVTLTRLPSREIRQLFR